MITAFGFAAALLLMIFPRSTHVTPTEETTTNVYGDLIHTPSATGNIALAYAYSNVNIQRLAIFVHSWATRSPGTKLVIFTHPDLMARRRVAELYDRVGVEAIAFNPPPIIDDPTDKEDMRQPGRIPLSALQHYLLYLEQKPGDITKGVAILGAVENIALQGDPFANGQVRAAVAVGKVLVSEEGGAQLGGVQVQQHEPTLDSVSDCYGTPGVASLGEHPLLSADAVLGRRDAILQYVRLLADILDTRVRFRCLRNRRPDIAALAHSVYEIGKDPLNLDFVFTIAKYKDVHAPVFGASLGFPAVMDGYGIVHRSGSRAAAELLAEPDHQGPIPSIITQYDSHPELLKIFISLYRPDPVELEFVQSSGYIGKRLGNTEGSDGDPDGDDDLIPESWEEEIKRELAAARHAAARVQSNSGEGGLDDDEGDGSGLEEVVVVPTYEELVDRMVKKRTGAAKRLRKQLEKMLGDSRNSQVANDYQEDDNSAAAAGAIKKKMKHT
jgi:hypothetical protein